MEEMIRPENVIKIESKYPDLEKNIKVIKYLLLPLEYWCLERAFLFQRPATTGEYYNQKLIETYAYHKRKELDKLKIEALRQPRIKPLHKERLIQSHNFEVYRLNKAMRELKATKLREFEQELRESNVKFPAYTTVANTLKNLESWGVIARRELDNETSKASFYWIINSAFYLKYGDAIEDLIEFEVKD